MQLKNPPFRTKVFRKKIEKRDFYSYSQATSKTPVLLDTTTPEYNQEKNIQMIWCHGWGFQHSCFSHLIDQMPSHSTHWMVDFPGFGAAPAPEEGWSVTDYARDLAHALRVEQTLDTSKEIIFVGHSFGCRVALELEKYAPELFHHVIMIAPPGIAVGRLRMQQIFRRMLSRTYRFLRPYLPKKAVRYLQMYLGSTDYLAAQGVMRKTLVKVVAQDLACSASKFTKKTLVIASRADTQTPLDSVRALCQLMSKGMLCSLEHFTHTSLLTEGSCAVGRKIREFILDSDE